ncbi:MAG: hypothetical protein WCN88_00320 [Candidatus Falkowbacteria bacterium]
MLERIWKIIILILIISALALLQFSLISALPEPYRQFNLVLTVLTFTLFFIDFRVSLIAALIAGFWLDVLSFHFFGFYFIIFFFSLLVSQWILKNWLTNRSLYSLLALMVSSTFFYNFLAAIILYTFSADYKTFFLFQSNFWLTLFYQSIWSVLSALILFNLAALVSKRIKPFFLEKKSFI